MNMTDEQIDTAITALQAMKAMRKPLEFWVVTDRDGDQNYSCSSEMEARVHLEEMKRNGSFGPYILHQMREVMP